MTPEAFLNQLARQEPDPVYLFVGPEGFRRDRCRTALLGRVLTVEEREEGYVRHDLAELTLAEVLDDANSLSLFAGKRLIWVSGAELALPKGRAAAASESEDEDKKAGGSPEQLAQYVSNPSPGTVVVFDCSRFGFDSDDKAKLERLRKFYGAIRAVVEFTPLDPQEARMLVKEEAQARKLKIGSREIDLLVESVGADASRLVNEIEKLSLLRGTGAAVSEDDIGALVANARESTIFSLVNNLSRGDRKASLDVLDTLVREGEYLPLALTFLGSLFRQALAAKEQGLKSSMDVENYFRRMGAPMWRSRAEQISQTASRLSRTRLQDALKLSFEADRDLKGTRPDDRVVLEKFVFALTAPSR